MSVIITRYFDLAQLALASYTDFTSEGAPVVWTACSIP